MARKGSRKVRTGCITCKIRKIKCDETKPACNRCIATGRKCDGYQVLVTQKPSANKKTWRIRIPANYTYRTFPGVNIAGDVEEGRALQYFCEAISPFLSGAVDPYFWTHVVMQFSAFEPSVKHSLVAISNLYEQIERQDAPAGLRLQDQRFALQHYNAAIHELKAITSWEKQPVVLIVCVLFICIEFLLANRKAALRHCTHGVAILRSLGHQSPWTEEHLFPLFRRLMEMSFFFGEKSDVPDTTDLERPIPAFFSTYHEAQLMIDDIYNRTFQFLKRCDPYRSGPRRGEPVCQSIIQDKRRINQLLDLWRHLFASSHQQMLHHTSAQQAAATTTTTTTENLRYPPKMMQGFLITRYECCRVWLNLALCGDECGFDQFVNNFKRVAKVLKSVVADVSSCSQQQQKQKQRQQHACCWLQISAAAYAHLKSPKFVFETGFSPMLFSIVATCRHLETRLQILQVMPLLCLPRENLWESDTLVAVARRMVEMEHGITLDACGRPLGTSNNTPPASWPPLNTRVLDVSMDADTETRRLNGRTVSGKVVAFYQRNTAGGIDLRTEFVVIGSTPVRGPTSAFNSGSEVVNVNTHFTPKSSEQCEQIEPSLSYSNEGVDGATPDRHSRSEPTNKARWKSVAGAYSWDVEYSKQK